MSSISDFLISSIVIYGAPLFGAALVLGAVGIPIPTSLMVIAAGAFFRLGLLNGPLSACLGLIGAVIGDSLSFGMGRWGGRWIKRRFGGSSIWINAQDSFQRSSWMSIFLTRFLFTGLAIPVNWMAGSTYNYWRFLMVDIPGEIVWIAVYGGMGYLFGSQWEIIGQFFSDFGGLAFGLALLVAGSTYLYRQRR